MLRQKKNWIPLLTTSLIIFSGCKSVPTKPQVELCILDIASGEAICGMTNGGTMKADEATYNMVYGMVKRAANATRQPIEYVDHGICLRPMEWGVFQNYIHNLQVFIETQCKR